jgi:hypothetical protein
MLMHRSSSLCLTEFDELYGFLRRDEENSDTGAPLVAVEIDPLQPPSSSVGQDGFQRRSYAGIGYIELAQ